MTRPPHARESVLNAFERILIDTGARAATMDAVARLAGVSKGGLLYHFASKDALEGAMIERLHALVDEDVAMIEAAPEGPISYFVRSSAMEDDALDRAVVAASRLAQNGHPGAIVALRQTRERWEDALRPHVRDQTALELVMLVSDGLYFNNALGGDTPLSEVPQGGSLDSLVSLVTSVAGR